MIEEIASDLFKLDIPLPKSPLKAVNSYVVKGPERNLIIDTGWKQPECLDAMRAGLKTLAIDPRKTDFFITHSHSDHFGLLPDLITDTSVIYFNQPDAQRLKSGLRIDEFHRFARLNGFPEDELQASIRSNPAFRFRPTEPLSFEILGEGDAIPIGSYLFKCIETPGHSRGHMCLYEPDKRICVAGDHILGDITPNIQCWFDDWNPLKHYLQSLDKIDKLDVGLLLPGHRGLLRNCRERIRELKDHHLRRFDEIISILGMGDKDAFQIGSLMGWDIVYESWDAFPVSQKWFAIGEVIAHLKYLEERGDIRHYTKNRSRLYSLNLDS